MRNSRDFQAILIGLGIDAFGSNPEADESVGYEYTLADIERSAIRRQGVDCLVFAPTQATAGQRGRLTIFSGSIGLWVTHCHNPTHSVSLAATRLSTNGAINVVNPTLPVFTAFQNDAGQAYIDNQVSNVHPWSEFGVTITAGTTIGAFADVFAVGLIPISATNPWWIPPGTFFVLTSTTANATSEFHLRLRSPFAGRRYSTNFGANEVEFY